VGEKGDFAEDLQKWISLHQQGKEILPTHMKWLTWEQSTNEFLDVLNSQKNKNHSFSAMKIGASPF
jgi:hypothetical protein